MEESATQEEISGGSPSAGPSRSLMSVAGLVAGATLLSKGIGFIRQALIANGRLYSVQMSSDLIH